MKKFFKWAGITLLAIFLILFVSVMARQNRKFEAPYPQVTAVKDSALIERGRHLVFGPAHCANCHASPDMVHRVENGETVPLAGGGVFALPIGNLYLKNLTPDSTGIGNLSDSAIARALRYGVSTDGHALLDIMPFHHTSDSDLVAILSYLRSQDPVKNIVPKSEFNALGKVINAFVLEPAGPTEDVPKYVKPDSTIEYGKYLADNVANCKGCHTNRNLMTGAFTGEPFAGGLEFEEETEEGTRVLTTPNLTPDATSRIYGWSSEQFLSRMRAGSQIQGSHMPWKQFGKMSDLELTAVYKYLKSVKPVNNKIEQIVRIKK